MAPILDPIKKIIKKPIRWIGNRIEDVGDWVVDEIIDPVIETVEGTIDAMLDDPLKTIATITAAIYAPWAIPLIEGADVAMDGGDIGDILEATAKAYVAQQVGAKVGSYAGDAVSAGAQTATSKVVGKIVAQGSASATAAVIYGQDPVEAFLKGGIQAGVSASLGQLSENADYQKLPQAAKNVIESSITATLTGQEVTPELIASAVTKAYVTTEAVGSYLNEGGDFSDAQIAAITNGILNTANVAFAGGDVPKAIMDSVIKYGSQELNKTIDKKVKNTIDKVSGDYKLTADKAQEVDDAVADYEAAAANYNAIADEMKPRFDERARQKAAIDRTRDRLQNINLEADGGEQSYERTLEEYNNLVKTYNSYTRQLDKDYDDKFKPLLDKYKAEADEAYNSIEPLKTQYMALKDKLISSGDQLDDVLKPVQGATDKAFVTAMVGEDFNEEEYVKVNGLGGIDDEGTGEEFDPYYHWLTIGKDENLPTNQIQYNKQYELEKNNLLQKAIQESGLDITMLGPTNRKRLVDDFNRRYKTLQNVKDADSQRTAVEIANTYKNEQEFKYDLMSEMINKGRVSDADIADGNATVVLDTNGNASFITPDQTADIGYKWDPRFNKKVKTIVTQSKSGLEGKYDTVIEDEQGNVVQSKEYLPPFEGNDVYGILKNNPAAGINIIAELDPNSTEASITSVLGYNAYEFIKQAYDYAKTSDSDFLKNSAGIILDAGGELLSSYNSMLRYVNINPKGTKISEFSKKVIETF
jgi:hypothetical protein